MIDQMPDAPIPILLAEDTDDMRFLLEAAFDGSRFGIVGIARDGSEALTMWAEHRDEIGAVALDHRMPGLDGLDVARHILAEAPATKVVLFSAELSRGLRAEAEALGIGVLHKDDILSLPHHPHFA